MVKAQIFAADVHLQERLVDDVLPINEADDEEEALAALRGHLSLDVLRANVHKNQI